MVSGCDGNRWCREGLIFEEVSLFVVCSNLCSGEIILFFLDVVHSAITLSERLNPSANSSANELFKLLILN